ncbi:MULTISPECIES: DNA cytosine methyltransferase [Kamptonema]|uniref:DNA cytosine methyltransferase n=1 Tax=Kamptonema TaxID=1501433 RepID=UPI0001DAC5B4|nr:MULTISPECIES: DNA cytosine methyltransferase [Kamptonema]CBN57345.1 putative Modification methylase HgiDII [Kamptonema sp. PCC 6506]
MRSVKVKDRNNNHSAKRLLTAVDLFCGCGGVTEGLTNHNIRVVAAVDNNPIVCKTYKINHPNVNLYESDIALLDPMDIRQNDLKGADVDILVVCAPCQPFSSQNRTKKQDKRSNLIFEAVRFARDLRPSVIFFENVPGLATEKYREIINKLKHDLLELGYQLGEPIRVDAADYGVPQRRIRCILFAVLNSELPIIPPPITPTGSRITVRQAIGNLRSLKSGQKDPGDPLHYASSHLPIALKRLQHIPKDGGNRFSLPPELELKCHKNHKGHGDVYGRMRWDDVAPTLTTGCTDVTRGRFSHPEDDRAITLREAAILQSFPLDYKFVGTKSQITEQIGNAVPVQLMEALAPSLRIAINRGRK